MIRIVIEVPAGAIRPVIDSANRAGMSIPEFLLSAAVQQTGIESSEDRLRRLHALGFTDAAMARHLGTTNTSVARTRRRLNLPAHPHPRSSASKGHAA
jgi:hypothetical protein